MRGEQARRGGGSGQVGVQPQHHVSVRARAFQLDPRQQRSAVARAHELQIAVAHLFKRFFDHRTGAPVGHKTVVGIDGQNRRFGLRCGGNGCCKNSRCKMDRLHGILQFAGERAKRGVMSRPSLRRC